MMLGKLNASLTTLHWVPHGNSRKRLVSCFFQAWSPYVVLFRRNYCQYYPALWRVTNKSTTGYVVCAPGWRSCQRSIHRMVREAGGASKGVTCTFSLLKKKILCLYRESGLLFFLTPTLELRFTRTRSIE